MLQLSSPSVPRWVVIKEIRHHPALPRNLPQTPANAIAHQGDSKPIAGAILTHLDKVHSQRPDLCDQAGEFSLRISKACEIWRLEPDGLNVSYLPLQWFEFIKLQWYYAGVGIWRELNRGFNAAAIPLTIDRPDARPSRLTWEVHDKIVELRGLHPRCAVELVHIMKLSNAEAASIYGVSAHIFRQILARELRQLATFLR